MGGRALPASSLTNGWPMAVKIVDVSGSGDGGLGEARVHTSAVVPRSLGENRQPPQLLSRVAPVWLCLP